MNEYLSEQQIQELAELAEKDLLHCEIFLTHSSSEETETETEPMKKLETLIGFTNNLIFLPHVNDYFAATGLKTIIADARCILGEVYPLGTVVYVNHEGVRMGIADANHNWNQDSGTPLTTDTLKMVNPKNNNIINILSGLTEIAVLKRIQNAIRHPEFFCS